MNSKTQFSVESVPRSSSEVPKNLSPIFSTNIPGKKKKINNELLANATESILKILHPGRNEQQKRQRDQERERIKNHVLTSLKSSTRSKCVRLHYSKQLLPETSDDMKKRKRAREQRTSSGVSIDSKDLKTPQITFKFEAPKDIISTPPMVKPDNKRHVSFGSSVNTEKFPKSSFQTPQRIVNMDFSQPPPLIKQKRARLPDN